MALIDGYAFRVVARQGLAADVPTLIQGELGFDIDKKVARIGDLTPTPPRIMTDKSTGNFDYSSVGDIRFPGDLLFSGGRINGVNIEKLNQTSGLIVRSGNNAFKAVSLTSADGSLTITNNAGINNGNIDLRVNTSSSVFNNIIGPRFTASDVEPVDPRVLDWWHHLESNTFAMRATDGVTDFWIDFGGALEIYDTLPSGGGGGGGGGGGNTGQTAIFNIPSTHRYVLAEDLLLRGFDLTLPITVIATLPAGNILGSSGMSHWAGDAPAAFDTGTGFALGSTLTLNVNAGAHIIGGGGWGANGEAGGIGNGGNGSDAFRARFAITVNNEGVIAGGGGGGARVGAANANWRGDNGVSGGGLGAGIFATDPSLFKLTFSYFYAQGFWDHAGTGAGGGADGGAWGVAGGSAGSGTVGGNPGRAVVGAQFVTWTNTGSRYGAIV